MSILTHWLNSSKFLSFEIEAISHNNNVDDKYLAKVILSEMVNEENIFVEVQSTPSTGPSSTLMTITNTP